MLASARMIRAAVSAVQLRAAGQVALASTSLATVRIVAHRAAVALHAALKVQSIELSLRAQLIKAAAITGQFIYSLPLEDTFSISDARAVRLLKRLGDLAAAADQIAVTTRKARQDHLVTQERVIFFAAKGLADEIGISDVRVARFGKGLVNAAQMYDAPVKQLDRVIAEAIGIDDADPAKALARAVDDAAAAYDSAEAGITKVVADELGLSEEVSWHIAREIFDGVSITDDFDGAASLEDDQVMSLRKATTDVASATDTFVRIVYFLREPAETVGASDAQAAQLGKTASDSASAADAAAKSLGKGAADSASATDDTVRRLGKAAADTASATDAAAKSLSRSTSDNAGATDAAAKRLGKATSDALSATDSTTKRAGKGLSETTSASDLAARRLAKALAETASASELARFSLSRYLADAYSVSDAKAVKTNKGIADVATTSDAGTLALQGYCDITYFAADYVGTYISF